MTLDLPFSTDPFPRWLLLVLVALAIGAGVYCIWPAPAQREYADGNPVIVTRKTQRQLEAIVGGDLATAAATQRANQRQDSLAAREAFLGRQAKAAALHAHSQFSHAPVSPLSAASPADSVRELTRFFAKF